MTCKREKDFVQVWLHISKYLDDSLYGISSQSFQMDVREMLTVRPSMLSIKNNLSLEDYEFKK